MTAMMKAESISMILATKGLLQQVMSDRCWVIRETSFPITHHPSLIIRPSVMPYEGNEGARAMIFVRVVFLCPDDANQSLRLTCVADRNDESSVNFQLGKQRLRHIGTARRHKNRIVRSVRAPAQSAIETF